MFLLIDVHEKLMTSIFQNNLMIVVYLLSYAKYVQKLILESKLTLLYTRFVTVKMQNYTIHVLLMFLCQEQDNFVVQFFKKSS